MNIYGLYDPREPERIMYVGKESRPGERLETGHLKTVRRSGIPSNVNFNRWILSLLAQGIKPRTRVIEIVELSNWQAREKFWIAYWRGINPGLLNIADGGNGASIVADETRRRLAKVWKGRKHTVETRRKISKTILSQSPEHWDYLRGDNNSAKRPEERKKKRQQMQENHPRGFQGKHHTAEARKGMSVNNAMKRPEIAVKLCKPKSEETRGRMRLGWVVRKMCKLPNFIDCWESQHLIAA